MPDTPIKALAVSAPPALLMSLAVSMLALPSALLAFNSRMDGAKADRPEADRVQAGAGNSAFAGGMAAQSSGGSGLFRFTPAGMALHPDRAVTVAVRLDAQTVRTITVQGVGNPAINPKVFQKFASANQAATALRIAPTAYSLGVAHGYEGFDQKLALAPDGRKLDIADLSKPADISARIAIDDRDKSGRTSRNPDPSGKQSLDATGSYALSRNLNLTAGVRYSQDKDRLLPQSDGKKDSQAVFLGTQIRF